jgi:hypothetical protein
MDMFSLIKERNNYYVFSSYNALKDISNLYQVSMENDIKISDLKIKDTSLEEVFIHLIKEDSTTKEEMGNK